MKRLKNIESKNKEQLDEIEHQQEKQLDMVDKQGKKQLKAIKIQKVEKKEKLGKIILLKDELNYILMNFDFMDMKYKFYG